MREYLASVQLAVAVLGQFGQQAEDSVWLWHLWQTVGQNLHRDKNASLFHFVHDDMRKPVVIGQMNSTGPLSRE
jgi:hypothetical protein